MNAQTRPGSYRGGDEARPRASGRRLATDRGHVGSVLCVGLLVAALTLPALVAACGGGEESRDSGLISLGDLQGATIGVASVDEALVLETRFVLQEAYGLNVSLSGGDVALTSSPAEALPTLLHDGDVDAVAAAGLGAFRLLENDDIRVLSHVTEEMRELTGGPTMSTVLVTYPDVAEHKRGALVELNLLLAESLAYFRANKDLVVESVSGDQAVDPEYLRWWWEGQNMLLGDRSVEVQQQLLNAWEAELDVGDIDDIPDLADVLFGVEDEQSDALTEGDRITVSLALLDDPSRRAALYAIEQGIVASETVDLDVTYLPPSGLAEAAPARQYEVVEAGPPVVPSGAANDLEFIVLCAGQQNLDATLLFVRDNAARD